MVCEPWQYRNTSIYATELLAKKVAAEQKRVLSPGYDFIGRTKDTRRTHKLFFEGLTPPLYPQFAGNYRGAPIEGLIGYQVGVHGDPMVGIDAQDVERAMARLGVITVSGIEALDKSVPAVPPGHKLLLCVEMVCDIFVTFLTIHPYVDGNGHIARYVLWTILARFGFKTSLFTIEPRPLEKDYGKYIATYRRGQKLDLINWVLGCFYA